MKTFLLCALLLAYTTATCDVSRNGRCGSSNGSTYCTPNAFCSRYGWCGIGSAWSAHSSNSAYDGSAACVVAQQKPATRVVVLTNQGSNKVLDVQGRHFRENQLLIQWSNVNGENQRFQMVHLNATEFQLIPMQGQELSAQVNSNHDVRLQTRDASTDGIWTQDGDQIKNRLGECLSIRGGSTRNGAGALFWPCNGHNDQKWTVSNYTGRRRLHHK